MRPVSLVTFLLLCAPPSCATDDSLSSAVITDSAGVQIIGSLEQSWPDGYAWRLGEEPTLDIGMIEGDPAYEFFRIAGARRLSDGRFVVADAGALEVRYYDSGGNHLLSTGRSGSGPGEFVTILFVEATPEDTVLVFDFRSQRISYYDPNGAFSRSATMRFLMEGGGFPMYVAPFDDGTILSGVRTYFGDGEVQTGLMRDQIVYLRSSPDGELIDTLAVRPGGEVQAIAQEDRRLVGDRPFGRYPRYAVFGSEFFQGSSDRYEVEHFDKEGRLLRSYRRPIVNEQVTDKDIETYKREQLEEADERNSQLLRTLFDAVAFPEAHPAYGSFVADVEGNLWVEVYRKPGDDQPRWTVFDRDGRLLGEVQTPERFTVYQIGTDFVLGRWADDLDVQHLQMFELIKEEDKI